MTSTSISSSKVYGRFHMGTDNTQHTNLMRTTKVKKGRGQRKNKRDKAGRAQHVRDLPQGFNYPPVKISG